MPQPCAGARPNLSSPASAPPLAPPQLPQRPICGCQPWKGPQSRRSSIAAQSQLTRRRRARAQSIAPVPHPRPPPFCEPSCAATNQCAAPLRPEVVQHLGLRWRKPAAQRRAAQNRFTALPPTPASWRARPRRGTSKSSVARPSLCSAGPALLPASPAQTSTALPCLAAAPEFPWGGAGPRSGSGAPRRPCRPPASPCSSPLQHCP
jgi:hypothetical protein